MTTLYVDLETYSPIPISCGAYKYAEQAEILLLSWAIDDAPAQVLDIAPRRCDIAAEAAPRCDIAAFPAALRAALDDPEATICAHNSNFDRTVLRHCIPGHPAFETADRWIDSMIMASACGYPASLAGLCAALDIADESAKDKRGAGWIRLFCHPQVRMRTGDLFFGGGDRVYPDDRPEEWAGFVHYARLDVEAMRACLRQLPTFPWRNAIAALWHDWRLDQRVNDRGMRIDTSLVAAVNAEVASEIPRLDTAMSEVTGGAVQRCSLLAALRSWLASRGVPTASADKAALEEAAARPETDAACRRAIELRLLASLASVKKYRVLADATCEDRRLRGCLQFYGAPRSGRFSGKLFQPQNLPRGSMKPEQVQTAVDAFKSGCVSILYDSPSAVAKDCLRACIMAPEGRKLVVADLSNIEGRVLAWLAGEDWKVRAFYEYDAGRGPDLYKASYARTFGGRPEDVTKKQRQIGKVLELSMGYQGGVGAFVNFARIYGIDLEGEFTSLVLSQATVAQQAAAAEAYNRSGGMEGLSSAAWKACRIVQQAWRAAHPAITRFWTDVYDAARSAILDGVQLRQFRARRIAAYRYGPHLVLELPSGRPLMYPGARLDSDSGNIVFDTPAASRHAGFTPERTYSGKLVENVTQAVARDILVASMEPIERAGYEIVLSVHDEFITEAPDRPEFSAEELSKLMTSAPAWAEGLPLAAAGFEAYRYKKD